MIRSSLTRCAPSLDEVIEWIKICCVALWSLLAQSVTSRRSSNGRFGGKADMAKARRMSAFDAATGVNFLHLPLSRRAEAKATV